MYEIWTDGACEPNPGMGGWGYVMHDPMGVVSEVCCGELETTNNRMELTAILMAMRALPGGATATVYSDSQYCVNGLTIWRKNWMKRDWRRKSGEAMPNRDLWLDLESEMKRVKVLFRWVRGHSGNAGNERADWLSSIGRINAMNAQTARGIA
ncbi:MAG: ribonuclease HI [Gallionellaceae bacterium]|jgi:ribonuclease HI|nr:ribonuclease HI [Gallionellaceae bacterium]